MSQEPDKKLELIDDHSSKWVQLIHEKRKEIGYGLAIGIAVLLVFGWWWQRSDRNTINSLEQATALANELTKQNPLFKPSEEDAKKQKTNHYQELLALARTSSTVKERLQGVLAEESILHNKPDATACEGAISRLEENHLSLFANFSEASY